MPDTTMPALVWPERPTCHDSDWQAQRFAPQAWQARGDAGQRVCSYCGSIHAEDLLALLQSGKARLGGSDWKYGFPHKFYVYGTDGAHLGKFYSVHLMELAPETFDAFAPVLAQHGGITFTRDEKGIRYTAPHAGYQR